MRMFTDCLLAGVVLLGVLLISRPWRTIYLALPFAALCALVVAGGLFWQRRLQANTASEQQLIEKLPAPKKNEYITSTQCRSCHPDQYASWHRSFHRTMTQAATPDVIRGDFNDVRLKFDGDEYHMQRRGNEFWAELVDPDWRMVFALRQDAYERGNAA